MYIGNYLQGPEFSAITANTTLKMESPLVNRIYIGKKNFPETFNFLPITPVTLHLVSPKNTISDRK